MYSRFKKTKNALLFWTIFIGIGAVAGGTVMLIDPSGKTMGMDAMLPYFQVLPFSEKLFQNFVFPGIALLLVNGVTNLTAAALIVARKKCGVILGGIFGITLMAWIIIQFVIFPFNFMSTAYFIFGFIQALTGYAAIIFYNQENFVVKKADYPNIGTNKKEIVVFFSRMGYVKKIAYETANISGADVYEIKSTEKTDGTLGFWWCGRFAMHRWNMPIEVPEIDFTDYEKVTLCAQVWAFSLSAPVRTFCRMASGKIKKAEYKIVHYSNGVYQNAAKEADAILGLKDTPFTSIVCKNGSFKIKRLKTKYENDNRKTF